MHSRSALVSLAAVAVALAGCGKASGVATTTATTAETASIPGVTTYKPPPAPVATSYSVTLAGFKRGSRNGSGLALIGINPTTNELCWTISQLKNVPKPTQARLFRFTPGGTGRNGYKLGDTFKPSGCIHQPAVILGLIESKPEQFFVSIHTARFPGGAVRGAL